MTKLLEKAVAKARELPETEQDAIAQLVLDELKFDRKWDEVLEKSPEKLRKFADEAWAEHTAGRSDLLDPETL